MGDYIAYVYQLHATASCGAIWHEQQYRQGAGAVGGFQVAGAGLHEYAVRTNLGSQEEEEPMRCRSLGLSLILSR